MCSRVLARVRLSAAGNQGEREGKAKAKDRLRQGAAGRHPLRQARQASSDSRDIYDATE